MPPREHWKGLADKKNKGSRIHQLKQANTPIPRPIVPRQRIDCAGRDPIQERCLGTGGVLSMHGSLVETYKYTNIFAVFRPH